jgi:DNA-binding PucR family transcriptional regulator
MTMQRVMNYLGTSLLEVAHADDGALTMPVSGLVLLDSADPPLFRAGCVVLANGITEEHTITDLLRHLGSKRAAALIVRSPVPSSPNINAAAVESGVALIGLARGAAWLHAASLIDSVLHADEPGGGPALPGGLPSSDLFAFANAVSALLNASVTIEDTRSRVLAFSTDVGEEMDQARVTSILGRQVPLEYSRILAERGIFRKLYESDEPILIAPRTADLAVFSLPRVAVGIRAGTEPLGSIWVMTRELLTEAQLAALSDAAKLAALHLLRLRAEVDAPRRLRSDLVSRALAGTADSEAALEALGLHNVMVCVLAMRSVGSDTGHPSPEPNTQRHAERERVIDALAVHLGTADARSAVAMVGETCYALLPVSEHDTGKRAMEVASTFLERIRAKGDLLVGIGSSARGSSGIAQSRSEAEQVLRVLADSPESLPRVARLFDVQTQSVLLDLRDLGRVRRRFPSGPMEFLAAYDAANKGSLVETLRTWLDTFGDMAATSAALHVHPNTLRYRLRRISEVANLDLNDADARFSAMLALRLAND